RNFQVEGNQGAVTWCFCGELSPDERFLAVGESAGVHLFDWPTGKRLRLLKGHKLQVWAAVFSPKGDLLASSANMDQHILLWDVASGKELRRILRASCPALRAGPGPRDRRFRAAAGEG